MFSLIDVVVGYLVAYWHAFEAVLATTFALTFSFAVLRLDLGLAALTVIVLAEIRGVRGEIQRSGESWFKAMRNLRERLSDSAVALAFVVAAAFLFNLFRAPVVVWRKSLRNAQQVSVASQRTTDIEQCRHNTKYLIDEIARLTTQLQQARQGEPQAYIGVGPPTLTANHHDDTVEASVPFQGTGTASAENVASVSSVVLGNGPDAELIEGSKPPFIRILPSDPHGPMLKIGVSKISRLPKDNLLQLDS